MSRAQPIERMASQWPFPNEYNQHSCGSGTDLPPVLNGVRCVFCGEPAGKSYLCSRGRAVCDKKKCRFALAREAKQFLATAQCLVTTSKAAT